MISLQEDQKVINHVFRVYRFCVLTNIHKISTRASAGCPPWSAPREISGTRRLKKKNKKAKRWMSLVYWKRHVNARARQGLLVPVLIRNKVLSRQLASRFVSAQAMNHLTTVKTSSSTGENTVSPLIIFFNKGSLSTFTGQKRARGGRRRGKEGEGRRWRKGGPSRRNKYSWEDLLSLVSHPDKEHLEWASWWVKEWVREGGSEWVQSDWLFLKEIFDVPVDDVRWQGKVGGQSSTGGPPPSGQLAIGLSMYSGHTGDDITIETTTTNNKITNITCNKSLQKCKRNIWAGENRCSDRCHNHHHAHIYCMHWQSTREDYIYSSFFFKTT